MPISVECDCGKQFKVLDDLAGKRVKCPACKEIVAVPNGFEDEEPLDDEDERPSRRKKKKKKRAAGGSKIGLWIALAGGVLLLGFCCIGMGGGGYYYFVLSKSGEKTIVGQWQIDLPAQQKNDPNPLFNNMRMEFTADGTVRAGDLAQTVIRQWKLVKTDGNVVTIDISGGNAPDTVRATLTILDPDHLRYQASTPMLIGRSLYLKRVGK